MMNVSKTVISTKWMIGVILVIGGVLLAGGVMLAQGHYSIRRRYDSRLLQGPRKGQRNPGKPARSERPEQVQENETAISWDTGDSHKAIKSVDGATSAYNVSTKRYHVEATKAQVKNTVPLDMTIVNELCKDEDGLQHHHRHAGLGQQCSTWEYCFVWTVQILHVRVQQLVEAIR